MVCPICKKAGVRRSRRQTAGDYILSLAGIYPWRCRHCNGRFHSRIMSLSEALHAHCPICGNHDLKRISAEHVEGPTAFFWRFLRLPALRCEPCRYKYFSILPMAHRNSEVHTEHPSEAEEKIPVSSAH